ncbi:MAG: TetR/AcrR family transcriptional regulator [Spirochaetes bacterium]|nr:TetR/AcrR family transcriptional regulator [Spirochaetota bacterium]
MSKATTRKAILEEAGALFYRQGFNNTGLDAVRLRVGVSKPALYYHFVSKNALGAAYLEYRAEILFAMLENLLVRARSFEKYLASWATALIVLARRGKFYGCPFTAFASELTASERKYFAAALQKVEADWLRLLEKAYLKFHSDAAQANAIAQRILIIHTGCVMLYRASRDEKYLKQLKNEFAALNFSTAT